MNHFVVALPAFLCSMSGPWHQVFRTWHQFIYRKISKLCLWVVVYALLRLLARAAPHALAFDWWTRRSSNYSAWPVTSIYFAFNLSSIRKMRSNGCHRWSGADRTTPLKIRKIFFFHFMFASFADLTSVDGCLSLCLSDFCGGGRVVVTLLHAPVLSEGRHRL